MKAVLLDQAARSRTSLAITQSESRKENSIVKFYRKLR